MSRDAVYLAHILECIRRIEEDSLDGEAAFFSGHTRQDAILRNLQVLSESTQRLSDAVKSRRPEVPWREVSAFRNVLVHNYLGIDLAAVWGIVQRDIPVLKAAAEALAGDSCETAG